MNTKNFRVDWYPHAAFIDFNKLKAEEIGVLVQIINLIYVKEGPIEYEPKYIGKQCNTTRAKCDRIIKFLLDSENLFLVEGKLMKKRCRNELEIIQERRKNSIESGQKGAKQKWRNKKEQELNDRVAINEGEANINSSQSSNNNTNKSYNIDDHLSDPARLDARILSPGWDQQHLMRDYNQGIQDGKIAIPNDPDSAYPKWCAKWTKGKPP